MIFFLANIPNPTPGSVEQWLWAAAALMAIVALGKNVFRRTPADHQQFADKAETNKRLDMIEGQLSDVISQAAADKNELANRIEAVPYKTIALFRDMRDLLPRAEK